MAEKEYLKLPADCKEFTMESFDRIKGFNIVVLEDNPDTTDPYLCRACLMDCPERKEPRDREI